MDLISLMIGAALVGAGIWVYEWHQRYLQDTWVTARYKGIITIPYKFQLSNVTVAASSSVEHSFTVETKTKEECEITAKIQPTIKDGVLKGIITIHHDGGIDFDDEWWVNSSELSCSFSEAMAGIIRELTKPENWHTWRRGNLPPMTKELIEHAFGPVLENIQALQPN